MRGHQARPACGSATAGSAPARSTGLPSTDDEVARGDERRRDASTVGVVQLAPGPRRSAARHRAGWRRRRGPAIWRCARRAGVDSLMPAGGDQRVEDAPVARIDQEFRVPLHAEAEPVARGPRCPRSRRPARPRSPPRAARPRAPPGGAPSSPASPPRRRSGAAACPARSATAWPGSCARVGLLVRQGARRRVGDVLDQRAAERHRQQLLAAADAEHRQVALPARRGPAPVPPRCGFPSA